MEEIGDEYFNNVLKRAPLGSFHEVLPLHQSQDVTWKEVRDKEPLFPRGWYELAHLSSEDRIDFTKEYWLSRMPYHAKLMGAIQHFFSSLDDVGVYLLQKEIGEPFEACLMYHLKEDKGFFRGKPSADDEDIFEVEKVFKDAIPPPDYLAFLRIHNGFSKAADTGLVTTYDLEDRTREFRQLIDLEDPIITATGALVNPDSLIPFYESFGMPVYQCFWTEWYPNSEMGNVYYSGIDNSLSDVIRSHTSTDNLAFKSFSDWLVFYLEILA